MRRPRLPLLLNYVVLTLLLCFSLGPLLILGLNSLKGNLEIGRNPLGPPRQVRWSNYPEAWIRGSFATTLSNSLIITSGTIVGVLLIAGLAAYALSRLEFRGTPVIMFYLLVAGSLPFQLFLVPLFFLWHRLGLVNTRIGLIIIYWAIFSPFATLLLRSYMMALPRELDDAARVDGANEWQVFSRVVLPASTPGFLTVGLVSGLSSWNEFLFSLTFLHDSSLKTVITSYYAFVDRFSVNWGLTAAGGVMMILPIIVIFLLLQRKFIEGFASGGLKA
ncbi:MAG: carbohydrate ABC transporter permease [Firmicutes bacterium]|nr:carbohydrate ABC transporter permease [Bacillota bacterium]